ncbi:MAG: hypothetical protein V2I34_02255 [Bacteroidales bacterium]|jgi:tetratricopeptide (TPR) repeat protein|nr:hypothetical protein [Bacteroidales bacterium]
MNRQAIKLLLLALILNSTIITAQSRRDIRNMFHEAESWFLFEEYEEALPLYLELLQINPDNHNYKYRIGICYLNIPGEKEKSLPYLQDASRHINDSYREDRFRETEAPYDVFFYLGIAYRISNQLDKALETYRLFYEGMDPELYDTTTVKQHIEACHIAKTLMDSPIYLELENQGEHINSPRFDVNPVVSARENTIVFTRELPFYEGIFYSRKNPDGWTAPRQLQEELLIDDGYTTSLSPDGNEMYIYRNDGYDGNIYVSRFSNGRWSPAAKLNDNINTKYWESHACISADGKTLYFTSNRKGSYGGLDIYVSEKDSLGNWGQAVNLGPTINTPFNEESPFIDSSGNILYFSSRGHYNMGGYDIFSSSKSGENEWSEPVNMGYPLNTTDDDVFFSPVDNKYLAYISRFDEDGFGGKDILRLQIYSDENPRSFRVRGIVRQEGLMSPYRDSVKISIVDRQNRDTLKVIYSDALNGEYEFGMQHGKYTLVYEADGYRKMEKEFEFALDHRGNIIELPTQVLNRSDFTARIDLISADDSLMFMQGDTATIEMMLEPMSVLVVEQMMNDSLLTTEEFSVIDPAFTYRSAIHKGADNIRFTLKDRFGNTNVKNYMVHAGDVSETVQDISETLIAGTEAGADIDEDVPDEPGEQELIARQKTLDSLDALDPGEAESIDRMGQVMNEVSAGDEAKLIKDAVSKTNELQIRHAGEWLQSMYSVAIEDGAEKEMLTRLIAAMSAGADDDAQDFINRLMDFADPALKNFLATIDPDALKINKPEDVIDYLLSYSGQHAYNNNEVFEALSRLINTSNKTAEEIISYLDLGAGKNLLALWILLGGMMIVLIFLLYRRKKKEESSQQ